MDKFLDCWDNQNKVKHGTNFREERKHFSMFVLSIDNMIGKEDLVIITTLSRLKAERSRNPFRMYVVGPTPIS